MAPAQKAIVELVYDLSNPFSYIALVTLARYQDAWNLELDLIPVYVPLLQEATGDAPPDPMAIKIQYLQRDIARLSERWGVDIRTPAGFNRQTTTLPVMNFLRTLKENESPEVLLRCSLLLFEELYSIQTPLASPKFYDCLVTSSSPSLSTPVRPLTRKRLEELLSLASKSKAKQEMLKLGEYAWEKQGAWTVPWMIAYKVPLERAEKVSKEGREKDVFLTVDRFEMMAYFLGPEYTWRGPFPEGDRFRPRAEGIPSQLLYPPAPRL